MDAKERETTERQPRFLVRNLQRIIHALMFGPRRSPTRSDTPHRAGTQTSPRKRRGIGDTDTDWNVISARLLAMCEAGEPFTSQRKLGARLGCSGSTIKKAVQRSPRLKGWAKRTAPPRAVSLSPIVMDRTPQSVEPDPANYRGAEEDLLPDHLVDALMSRLITEVKPEEQEIIKALSRDERQTLAKFYHEQVQDYELSPLSPDSGLRWARGSKRHKRV